jgi:hypothetical protein
MLRRCRAELAGDRPWPQHGSSQRLTTCNPTSPSFFEPGLPTHIPLHCSTSIGSSSRMTSTTCLRLKRAVLRNRKPPGELSRMRQGILSCCRPCSETRLARFFTVVRFDSRPSRLGMVDTALPSCGYLETKCPCPWDVSRYVNASRFHQPIFDRFASTCNCNF